jgi:hypothetical protein
MTQRISSSTDVSAMEVADSLAIYFAENLVGPFKDKFITFSERPRFVDLSECNGIVEKVTRTSDYNEVANTNIEAVFDLILKTAIRNQLTQAELPANILIISDMEFDSCAESNTGFGVDKHLFSVISDRYAEHGYKLPRLVFWNVCSRTGAISVIENDLGVALISGFSQNLAKMVMSGENDPWMCLVEQIMNPRYDRISSVLGFND